jgi:DNA-binding NarL/FixJ family response regulator
MILLLTSDLMFQSRIVSAARSNGQECVVDRQVSKLVERVPDTEAAKLAIIDLSLASLDLTTEIPLLHQNFPNAKVIAYGAHVDVERLQLAQDAGADDVLTRGQMDREMLSILRGV